MYRKQVRRRRAVLVLLVVACLVLISSSFSEGEGGPLHSVGDGVATVLGPVEEGANKALKPARDLVGWFDETFDARGENEELRAEVRDLRRDLIDNTGAVEEYDRLKEITKLTSEDDLASFESVFTEVSARSESTWNRSLNIDKGSSDGIAVDDAVVSPDGLVGRIDRVSDGSARVILLTDQESNVTAKVLKGGPMGLLGPEVGDPDDLIFEQIESDEPIRGRPTVVTAGFTDPKKDLSSRFPAGVPIGEVREESPGEQELLGESHVQPFADMSKLTTLAVLTGGGE